MTGSDELRLDTLLRSHGLSWSIDIFSPSENAVAHYLQSLIDLQRLMEKRHLGKSAPSIEVIERMAEVARHKSEAFLQALVSIRGVEILCAAWRIIQGAEIASLKVKYVRMKVLDIQVTVQSPYSSSEKESYAGSIGDVAFLRHLGALSLDGMPVLDGFHALRQT